MTSASPGRKGDRNFAAGTPRKRIGVEEFSRIDSMISFKITTPGTMGWFGKCPPKEGCVSGMMICRLEPTMPVTPAFVRKRHEGLPCHFAGRVPTKTPDDKE